MLENNRGSASILFMVVVLPFLFILAVVGIEVTQFFGMREEVRRIIDSEAKQSLARSYSPEYVERRIAEQLSRLEPYVEVFDVDVTSTAGRGDVVVKGAFNGALNKFVGVLLQQESAPMSFSIASSARRTRTIAFIILDRTLAAGSEVCGDEGFALRAGLVEQIARDLQAAGAEGVMVGVTPGVDGEIEIVSANDRLPRCRTLDGGSHLDVASIQGALTTDAFDSVSIAYRAVERLLTATSNSAVEQRAIIMVAPPSVEQSRAIPTTFSLLEHEAARFNVKVTGVGIVVGGPKDFSFFDTQSGSESGMARYLHVSESEARSGDLRLALTQHIQGQTFIAR